MPELLGHLLRWYQRTVARRHPLVPVVVTEAALLGVSVVLGLVVLRPDTTPHPERVSTQVDACDLGARGAAQVSFTLNNADRTEHNYQVHLVVKGSGPGNLGAGNTLVTHVGPSATVTSRMLVPVSGDVHGASCTLWAEVLTGDLGHHG